MAERIERMGTSGIQVNELDILFAPKVVQDWFFQIVRDRRESLGKTLDAQTGFAVCIACGDTGKNSKGGNCHPCKMAGRI